MRSLGDAAASGPACECPSHQDGIRTFRLDRIAAQPQILEEAAVPALEGFDINKYRKSAFRMFGADETVDVTLLCDNSVMRGVIDHFGTNAPTEGVNCINCTHENGHGEFRIIIFKKKPQLLDEGMDRIQEIAGILIVAV